MRLGVKLTKITTSIKVNGHTVTSVPAVSAAGHEASEGNGAAGEKPERTVGETGEVQRAGTTQNKSNFSLLIYGYWHACHPTISCCSPSLLQKCITTFIRPSSCINQNISQFLSVNETQDWGLGQFSG